MEGGKGPRLRDFLSGSLATWALGLAGLVGEAEDSEGEEEEEEEEPPLWLEKRFLRLSDGALLLRVLGIIAPSSRGGPRMLRGLDGPAAWRVWNLNRLWGRLRDFYQEELQLLILSPPPDLQTLGFDPLSEEAVEQLEGVLRLLLGASVQCEHRELFIRHIQGLSLEVQSELAAAIQEVTQPGAGVVLALSGPEPGDLAPAELEMLSRSLMGTLSKLARERDLGAQEERVLSGVLEASKALLEEQLEAARERCARLHETQRENLLLRTRLGEAHAELDSLRHQVDQLAEENVELELELQRSLEPPPGSPGEAPLAGAAPSLQDEVREAEAGRLRTLERENRELRGLLQVLQGQPGGQHPLLEAPREDPVLPVLEEAPQTPVASDHSPQGLVQKARDGGPQALDLAPLALDSVLEASAECPQAPDSDPQEAESPLQAAAMDPQASDWSPQESGSPVETQESPEKAGLRSSLQSPASVAPPQGPGTKIQAPQLLGGETEGREAPQGELVPEARGLRQEGPEHKPGPSEPSSVQLEEQEGPNQGLDLATGQAEAREHDQRLEGTVRVPAWQKPQQKSEGALEVQVWEGPIPGESLASGVAEQEALREEVAQLRRKAEALGDELEAQARKLEAQNTEAARLSKELAQARRAEAEAHREAEAKAWEQARLREAVEAAGRELESASQEREALVEALAAAGRERRQWEREGSRLRAQSEAAEERMQVLESEGRQHLEEAERERREKEALQAELEKAVVRGKELGARLEHLQCELEQAALERQEFLREKESQHQRYQGLEQRLEAELQAAATSKEEALMELKTRALQLEEELFQLRQGPVGLGPKKRAEPRLVETQNVRLIEVERSNAMLVAEKAALQGQLQHLEGQLGSLQGRAQELLLQSQRAQEHSSRLQAEKSVLEIQGQELHRKLEVLEEEVRAARQSQEETRGQQQALLRDHEALAQLQRRQEAELEGLLVRHRDLKANMRALELAHRELQGRHEQLQAQRASVEAQEVALLAERERLMQDGHRQRGLEEELRRLQSEHDRAQMLLAEVSRERGELQGERGELRGRLARLELERAQLEMQSQQLRESNQQLDLSACRLTTQCELLTQLRSAQEEENRQLLAEVQALSRENRELLERSLESRDHLHREQREYLDQLNALRREKQKLVEKIMDQYRVLEPVPLPRTKKGSWLADKVKRLMRPRREGGPPGGLRLGADGAGSTESLGGPPETELPEGREADGTGSPSPAPMRRAQSSLCLRDETLAGGQRRKLSSRFPVGRSSESFSPGDTPRQRFRQRHPGPLGAPVSHSKGPGVGWENSAETLQEHETDANREGPEAQEPEKRPLTPSLSQ
uniref:Coiled-coil domain-containing protein 88B n=1 Tax=Pan paniscus TaxID=9597 RepID=A0A2R9AUG4_PANPA